METAFEPRELRGWMRAKVKEERKEGKQKKTEKWKNNKAQMSRIMVATVAIGHCLSVT